MSSPFRPSDSTRSTPRSSPSRQRLSESRNGRLNGFHRPGRDSLLADSPSRQLWEEFSRVVVDDNRNFARALDAQTAEQERLHRQALDASLAQHEAVRQSAERARVRVEYEIKREQERRAELERQAIEEQELKLAEERAQRERKRLEDAKRREDQRREAESLKQQQEEHERQTASQREQEEAERAERAQKAARDKEAADWKVQSEDAERRRRQSQQQQPPPQPQPSSQPAAAQIQQPNGTAASPAPPTNGILPQPTATTTSASNNQSLTSTLQSRKAVHQRYIGLWKHLKDFRNWTETECKKTGFKQLGEMKRTIRTQLGMINKLDKAANRTYLAKIEAILKQASALNTPSVDVAPFLISTNAQEAAVPSRQYPAILLYLLNQLAKSGLKQLVSENGTDTASADPIGILLVQIFARPEYQWQGHSLIDILWAKYHVLCPQLFGVPAREAAAEEYWWRCTGLAAGFSALTLRDFSRSKNANPAPNRLWWEAVARIVNLPAEEVQATHFVLLKALVEEFVPRIIGIFGGAGKALLRKAVVEFPAKGNKKSAGVVALQSMQMTLQQKYGLTL
ncbi:hypothetical protein BAUCODRAFT_153547 [Baudoinia panamericana UAMH 10762]|uniref:mRNA export factor GLE1 n=1 Tax=Baudoinia panamericana (strain UAMH 10762) TaxID=717646 RepID=M2NQA4_BAUPA|nr:uncharacterized protein BAUCODRAFT_153547 [Baudoinia panamericana UAMH 10762]EMD01221.1 hypothetical protein BAUCODRAFT_153547 [Baudoinia panamericana UAMH 10762]